MLQKNSIREQSFRRSSILSKYLQGSKVQEKLYWWQLRLTKAHAQKHPEGHREAGAIEYKISQFIE